MSNGCGEECKCECKRGQQRFHSYSLECGGGDAALSGSLWLLTTAWPLLAVQHEDSVTAAGCGIHPGGNSRAE